jgi:putative membrane protein
MATEQIPKETQPAQFHFSDTDLAFERTLLAHERTLMAWVRTATAMISFGFTLYKFFDEVESKSGASHRLLSTRVVGMVMIAFGVFSLVLAQLQHQRAIRILRENYPSAPTSISSVLGILMLLFGLLLFLAVLFRQ